jgi:apolipoprotein N-acyltransferase
LAFDKNHDFIRPYGKRHLVPFGEYLPAEQILTKLFPFVSNISQFDSAMTPGGGADIMEINGVNYGGLVCFDSIFPELARKSVRAGADVLIIVTNDSWFRDSPAIYQHNAQAVLRAVENNRFVVRAANTGLSSFISPTGKILQKSEVLKREVMKGQIEIVKNKTVYTIFGDIILYLSFLYTGFCAVLKISAAIRYKF